MPDPEVTILALALRGELAARVAPELAHDAKNPLHALSIHLGILGERLDKGAPQVARSLQSMRDQVERIDGMLRTVARLGAPQEETPAPLGDLVNDVLPLLAHQLRKRSVEAKVSVGELLVPAFRGLLRDLVASLALLVLETGSGPRLEISAGRERSGWLRMERGGGAPDVPPGAWEARVALCRRVAGSVSAAIEWSPGSAVLHLPGGANP